MLNETVERIPDNVGLGINNIEQVWSLFYSTILGVPRLLLHKVAHVSNLEMD